MLAKLAADIAGIMQNLVPVVLVALASLYPIILMLGYSLAWSWNLRDATPREP